MELKNHGLVGKLIEELDERTEAIGEQARQFPASREEYMALPLEQRMEIAKDAVKKYSTRKGENSGVTATFTTEREGVVIESRLGYVPERGTSALNDYYVSKYEGVQVSVRAVDTKEGVVTVFSSFGEIEWGGYEIDDGSKYGQWVRGIHANLPYTEPPSPRIWTNQVALDAPEAIELVSIIDEITCTVINGTIARERQLGSVGVAAAQVN